MLTPIATRVCLAAALCSAGLIAPAALPLRAEIASPSNAGGNSGNNATGTSITPISSQTFQPALSAAMGTDMTVNLDIVVNPNDAAPLQVPNVRSLATPLDSMVKSAQTINISSLKTGNTGDLNLTDSTLTVTVKGMPDVVLPITPDTRAAIAEFAAVAIVLKLEPAAITTGSALVAAGAPGIRTAQLFIALQVLKGGGGSIAVANGIAAYNVIVETSSPATLQALAANPDFQAARQTLVGALPTGS